MKTETKADIEHRRTINLLISEFEDRDRIELQWNGELIKHVAEHDAACGALDLLAALHILPASQFGGDEFVELMAA